MVILRPARKCAEPASAKDIPLHRFSHKILHSVVCRAQHPAEQWRGSTAQQQHSKVIQSSLTSKLISRNERSISGQISSQICKYSYTISSDNPIYMIDKYRRCLGNNIVGTVPHTACQSILHMMFATSHSILVNFGATSFKLPSLSVPDMLSATVTP